MVYVVKDTVDIYCFGKNWYETAQEQLLFNLQSVFFKANREVPAFFFQNCTKFSNSKPRPLGKESWAKSDPPAGSENVRIPGGRPEGGWSDLESTDTLNSVKGGSKARTPKTCPMIYQW